jgi:hypothetical protein
MRFRNTAWGFGIIYTALSLGVEIILLVVVRLRIPQDNKIIAPIILVVAPLLAAWVCGYRKRSAIAVVAVLALVLTLLFTMVFGRLTGISTGLGPPILIRSLAGFFAALATQRLIRNAMGNEGTK